MPLYKKILGRFYALYALLIFLILLLPAAILFFLVKNFSPIAKKNIYIHQAFVSWMGIYMPLIFCPVKVFNAHLIRQACVVVLNHNSFMDIPVSSPGIPLPNKTLGKSSFLKIPIFGYIYGIGGIMVNRKSVRSKVDAFIKMKKALQDGFSVCLYPEGTRNTSNQTLLPFKDGAFKLAQAAQVPIVTGIILNTKKILPPNGPAFWAWPNKIELKFIACNTTTPSTTAEALMELCFRQMKTTLEA